VPIFTVANVDGTPKTAIRGDMYATGTIAGSKIIAGSITATQIEAHTITADKIAADTLTANEIQAGAINTSELAINSVDILRIIDGAASNTTAAAGTAPTFGGTACSLTIDVRAGRAIAWATIYPSSPANGDAALYLDGGLLRSVTTQTAMATYDPTTGAVTQTIAPPPVIMAYVTGLTDGNHTFTLNTANGGATGTLIVNNPRR
jgi:hypothetical protein